jgi:hypothetical protein
MLNLNRQACFIEESTHRCGALYPGMSKELREPSRYGYVSQTQAASRTKNATYLPESRKLVSPVMKRDAAQHNIDGGIS